MYIKEVDRFESSDDHGSLMQQQEPYITLTSMKRGDKELEST